MDNQTINKLIDDIKPLDAEKSSNQKQTYLASNINEASFFITMHFLLHLHNTNPKNESDKTTNTIITNIFKKYTDTNLSAESIKSLPVSLLSERYGDTDKYLFELAISNVEKYLNVSISENRTNQDNTNSVLISFCDCTQLINSNFKVALYEQIQELKKSKTGFLVLLNTQLCSQEIQQDVLIPLFANHTIADEPLDNVHAMGVINYLMNGTNLQFISLR